MQSKGSMRRAAAGSALVPGMPAFPVLQGRLGPIGLWNWGVVKSKVGVEQLHGASVAGRTELVKELCRELHTLSPSYTVGDSEKPPAALKEMFFLGFYG